MEAASNGFRMLNVLSSSPTPRNLNCLHTTAAAQSLSSIVTETNIVTSSSNSSSVARRLVLLRHAESCWQDRSIRDHDRPLSKAGRSDAIDVSRKLQQLGWVPEIILSSDSTRTRETLNIMQEQVKGILEAKVHFIPSFYSIAALDGQTADHLQQAICEYSRDEILTVIKASEKLRFLVGLNASYEV